MSPSDPPGDDPDDISSRDFRQIWVRLPSEDLLNRARICLEFDQYDHANTFATPRVGQDDPIAIIICDLAQRLRYHQQKREPADIATFESWVTLIRDKLGRGSPEHLLMTIRLARRRNLTASIESADTYDTISAQIREVREELRIRNRLRAPDRVLGLSTMEIELDYQRIALEIDDRRFESAYEHIEAFRDRHGPVVHGALWVAMARTRRALGHRRHTRIDDLEAAIERLTEEAFEATIGTRPVVFTHSRYLARLYRHLAVAHAASDPAAAMNAIVSADRHRSIEFGQAWQEDPPVHSYAGPLYALMLNDGSGAVDLAAKLLIERGSTELATELRRTTGADGDTSSGPDVDMVSPGARRALSTLSEANTRAVLAVVRVLRAVGRTDVAWYWLDLIPDGHLRNAHRLSLEREMGWAAAGIESFDPEREPLGSFTRTADYDAVELLWSEYGRSNLAAAHLDTAELVFSELSRSTWFESEADGRAGLVDVKRRRRMLRAVRGDVEGYTHQYRQADLDPPADLEAAGAWTELQIGDPRRAVVALQRPLEREPYSATAWIGLVRGLRLLGRPKDAHRVCQLLSGHDPHLIEQIQLEWLRLWLVDHPPPSLHTRHGGLIDSEAGWCAIDASAWDLAHDHFTRSLRAMPYFVSAHRGVVAATTGDGSQDLDRIIDDQLAHAARRLPHPIRRDGTALELLELELHLEAGAVRAAQHLPDEARRHLARAAELSLTTPGADRHRTDRTIASIHIDLGDLTGAAHTIPSLRDAPSGAADDRQQILAARYAIRAGQLPDVWVEGREVRWSLGTDDPLEPGSASWITAVICLFEARRFHEAERVLDAAAAGPAHGTDPAPNQTLAILRSWVALARSELPYVAADERKRLIHQAYDHTNQLERWTVDDLHVSAIAEARRAQIDQGSMAPARRQIQAALAKRPRDISVLRDAAAIANITGDTQTARRHLRLALELDPTDPHSHLVQGLVRWSDHDRAGAVQAFTAAVQYGPEEPSHHRALIVGLLETGRPHDALMACDEAIVRARTALHGGHTRSASDTDGQRTLVEMEVLRARVAAAVAGRADGQAGDAVLWDAARRLHTIGDQYPGRPDEARAELLTREAYLWFRAGDRRTARKRLDAASRIIRSGGGPRSKDRPETGNGGRRSDGHPSGPAEYNQLAAALKDRRSASWKEWTAIAAVVIVLVGVAAVEVTRYVLWLTDHEQPGPTLNGVILLIVSFALLALAPQIVPRIRAINVRDVSVELAELRPGDDLVRIDLDSSAGRITQISGFTNFRPSVPLEETESRIKDPSL